MSDVERKSEELRGECLAWAACALWGVPAAIFSGQVHAQSGDGSWHPFDLEAMLAAIIARHVETMAVPEELANAKPPSVSVMVSTVGHLRGAIAGLPDDRPVRAQVVAGNGNAWNMDAIFTPLPQSRMDWSLITLTHPELARLPPQSETS